MTTQPEALRLADYLESCDLPEAAAELRRLHEECQRLAAEVANRNRRAIEGDEAVKSLDNVHKYYENLHALNQELLEALKLAMPDLHGYWRIKAEEAIAKAEGEKQ